MTRIPCIHPPAVLYSETQIRERVVQLAQAITEDFEGEEITAICVLKGSIVFFSDLIREIQLPLCVEFLGLSSYGNSTRSSGEVKLTLDVGEPLENKNILIVEDIVDTGLTLGYVMEWLKARKARSIQICTLFFKPDALKARIPLDYVGFQVGNEFLVGYGIDYAERFRELPFVGVLENEH